MSILVVLFARPSAPLAINRTPLRMQHPINKMTALGGQTLLVAIDLLAFFVAFLRLDRQRGDRASFQAF